MLSVQQHTQVDKIGTTAQEQQQCTNVKNVDRTTLIHHHPDNSFILPILYHIESEQSTPSNTRPTVLIKDDPSTTHFTITDYDGNMPSQGSIQLVQQQSPWGINRNSAAVE